MCQYCDTYAMLHPPMNLGDLFICQYAQYTYYGDGKEYDIPMRYCPACGRKLPAPSCKTCFWTNICKQECVEKKERFGCLRYQPTFQNQKEEEVL